MAHLGYGIHFLMEYQWNFLYNNRKDVRKGCDMAGSRIEWTESTWNPLTGCNKVSPGCKHCYAERMAKRLQSMSQEKYRNGFRLTLHPEVLKEPLSWHKPQTIFVNSMSDLFHENVPVEFIQSVF